METVMIHSTADGDTPLEMRPGFRIEPDEDGDVWIRFSEGDFRSTMKICMNREQFLPFVAVAEGVRNSIELAVFAEEPHVTKS